MTDPNARSLGNVILLVGVLLLIVNVCMLFHVIPRFVPPNSISFLVLLLVLLGSRLRRRGAGARA